MENKKCSKPPTRSSVGLMGPPPYSRLPALPAPVTPLRTSVKGRWMQSPSCLSPGTHPAEGYSTIWLFNIAMENPL